VKLLLPVTWHLKYSPEEIWFPEVPPQASGQKRQSMSGLGLQVTWAKVEEGDKKEERNKKNKKIVKSRDFLMGI
jgi:hypothetical protein